MGTPLHHATVSTYVYKTTNGLTLSLDVWRPTPPANSTSNDDANVALVHFHGGFLMVGEKTTFPPYWLINACLRRGWTYITPAYRLLPETPGLDIIDDALDAAQWVAKNVSERLVIAGSSAGGFLALSVATRLIEPKPVATLCVYGILDLTAARYTNPGKPVLGSQLMPNVSTILHEMEAARDGDELDGYAFPDDLLADKRMSWINAAHQEAIYPDLLSRSQGLAAMIRTSGPTSIPEAYRALFPSTFGASKDMPPVAFLHGGQDDLVDASQSIQVSEHLQRLGVDTICAVVPGKGHGFDVEIAAEVDVEEAQGVHNPAYTELKSVLGFIDNAVRGSSK
ncbi:alpha/beta-hydrolase [Aaosphaeria arxii CBS 175.79]|uniref:Alpha/beta-hydrolase n=1 Tax=Aaosphaeria arxii CBS 175.79 TaxID=1450172 RepID=A0A6A5Y368_9PLEO|nr:alpha/beta-hydrolase [Aaosphaeria arxii CBS 175.79]KAF2019972.1 alpha/beta-hydrolase [Aaosphaeria arxii CBS 175.79]